MTPTPGRMTRLIAKLITVISGRLARLIGQPAHVIINESPENIGNGRVLIDRALFQVAKLLLGNAHVYANRIISSRLAPCPRPFAAFWFLLWHTSIVCAISIGLNVDIPESIGYYSATTFEKVERANGKAPLKNLASSNGPAPFRISDVVIKIPDTRGRFLFPAN